MAHSNAFGTAHVDHFERFGRLVEGSCPYCGVALERTTRIEEGSVLNDGPKGVDIAVPYGLCLCCETEYRTIPDIGLGPGWTGVGGRRCKHTREIGDVS